jgi:CBS domain-containing membrane protein
MLFLPKESNVSVSEKIFSALAGLVGIGLVMVVSQFFLDAQALPWVVASMGASAVLLFAVPQGPLSQPWSFVGGHLLSAFVGITVAKLVADPVTAAALAVSMAIFVMYLTDCLHPPGGATALTAVVGGSSVQSLGYAYMLTPVSLNILVMLGWALIINNLLSNRHYPNGIQELMKASKNKVLRSKSPSAISRDDLHDVLHELDVFVDVSEDDLGRIFDLATLHARKKQIGDMCCRDIMTPDPVTVEYDTEVEDIWKLMVAYGIHAFPVIDQQNFVLGVISHADFMDQVKINDKVSVKEQLVKFIKRTNGLATDKHEYAGHLMSKPAITIGEQQHIVELFDIFNSRKIHHIPVVDQRNKLVGIITPKDLLVVFQSPAIT